ncbi:oxidoreductase [Gluconacetobacter tumulisoli]|uniref:NADH:flavin oxidoreductase n=1 Tax=Gluconacetobacter tumulisoli TaxID=1286189 RepID=A0A7W4K8R6_9PROT|nr:NADH:flavin oxidoreductase [Gluconacetobacter tumulisoli]MBB2202352.1 NADH:flavin oxidoreductase [Gluconacetobacter tumulisoli]
MQHDPLLRPFALRHLTLRNRIITTSHEPAYAEDGMPKARYRAYHVERARAGVALTMTAGSASVSRDSPPAFNNILLYKDEVVPWLRDLAESCHAHGAAVMIQITHLGRRTRWDKGDWLPSISASTRKETAHRAFAKKAEDWDIARIIRDYADAAERVRAAGLDGIEVEAYGHLVDQFWSPLTNDLDAPWGGSAENRQQFAFAVLRAIRDRVGPDFIVGIRFTADERLPGGLTAADGLTFAQRLRDLGLVDFLNVIRGHIDTDAGLTDVIPIQGMRNAPFLDFAGHIRAETGLPTLHAAKIPDVATARHAIASGKLDLVGMTRAHMADPHIVARIVAGQEDEIRPCVGANYCLDRIYQGEAAHCIHNPATGRELTMPHVISRADRPRRVTIVGAGPAGLEAARVCAERGHAVTLFEAAPQAGGQILLTARSERRREMISIVDWRMRQCERHGVSFCFSCWADRDAVLDTAPDVVIVATGGFPDTSGLPAGQDLVSSAWDILSGDVAAGRNVLLYDDAGDHAALQAAEAIAATGAHLTIVTPDRTFAPEVMGMNLVPYLRALQARDVTFTVTYRLLSVARDGNGLVAMLGSDYGGARRDLAVDQVVVNYGTIPMDDLYFELRPLSRNGGEVDYDALIAGRPQTISSNDAASFSLFRIGDAVSSRNVHAAIYDALRLAKDL